MILVSLGNLGDLLIQAAYLRRFDRAGCSIAVPESYAHIASELFAQATFIPMPDQWSDGRMLAEAQRQGIVEIRINDPGGRVHELEEQLQQRFGLRDVRVAHSAPAPRRSEVSARRCAPSFSSAPAASTRSR